MDLEQRTLERVESDFAADEREAVRDLLKSYAGPEPARVAWDILHLSKGNLGQVRKYRDAAQTDYRDVLYWAEYYATDPLVQGKDAKRRVGDLLAKWGEKK